MRARGRISKARGHAARREEMRLAPGRPAPGEASGLVVVTLRFLSGAGHGDGSGDEGASADPRARGVRKGERPAAGEIE